VEIYVPLEGLIDFEKERARLDKEIEKVRAELGKVERKLSNDSFLNKAPADIIEKERSKREEFTEVLAKLESSLTKLGSAG
jgi:valyl-tRNA synthetase